MNKLLLTLLLFVPACMLFAVTHSGDISVRSVVKSHEEGIEIEVQPISGTATLLLNIDLPSDADLWVSVYANDGTLIGKDHLHGNKLSHLLHFNFLTGDEFQVNISYVYGGLLHVAKVHRYIG